MYSMCWNASVSFQSFFIGMIGIVWGMKLGLSLPFVFFYTSIVLMQFIEYLMWTYGSIPSLHLYISLAAAGLLSIQPITSILTLYPSPLMTTLLICYIGIGSIYLLLFPREESLEETYRMYKGKDGHLVWNWIKNDIPSVIGLTIYFTFLCIPLVIRKSWDVLSLVLFTLCISLYYFHTYHTWGSMWCWVVNAMVIITCFHLIVDTYLT